MGALADALNRVSDDTGISAQAVVGSESVSAVAAGSTGSDFAINGVTIGALTVLDNDADEALTKAINAKTAQHGVVANITGDGKLELASSDGRAIEVSGSTGDVLAGSNMSTLGYIKLFQTSGNEIQITDKAGGAALASSANVSLNADVTTTIDSKLAAGSVFGAAASSTLKAGTTVGFNLSATTVSSGSAISTTQESTLKAGSTIGTGSVIEAGSTVGGKVTLDGATTTTTTDSLLKAGTVLDNGTTLEKGTLITTDIQTATGTVSAGTVLTADTTINANVTLQADMIALGGSIFTSGTSITAGSSVGADVTAKGAVTLTEDMTLKANSTLQMTGTTILAGSKIGGDVTTISGTAVTTTQDTLLAAGSTIAHSGSSLASGSTIGGTIVISGALTLNADMTFNAGSTLKSGTTLAAGTLLTNDVVVTGSAGSGTQTLEAGTVLDKQYKLGEDAYLENAMTVKYDATNNSVIATGSTIAENDGGVSGTEMENVQKYTLADIDVTTQEGAQVGITIADAALKSINAIKAELGSVQNQLTSTVANLSVTVVNVTSSESQIRDVDFAEESSNFSKMQVLMQSGTFALAQANASSQNVLQLLQ
jgi:flagellin